VQPRYEIELSRTAEKQLRKLAREDQERVVRAIRPLARDPRPRGCRKLSGYDDVFRVRAGPYRVIYSVSGRRLVVIILKLGHRRDVYR
jgi:mRNA interferase RelE/StbE